MNVRKRGIGVLSITLFVLLMFSGVCMAVNYFVEEASFNYRYNGSYQDINAYAIARKNTTATKYATCTAYGGVVVKTGSKKTLYTYNQTLTSGWTDKGTYSWGGLLNITGEAGYAWFQ